MTKTRLQENTFLDLVPRR